MVYISIITIPIISVVDMLVVMLSWKEGQEEGWVCLDQNMMYNDMLMIIITIIIKNKQTNIIIIIIIIVIIIMIVVILRWKEGPGRRPGLS